MADNLKYKALRGMPDVLPQTSEVFAFIEKTAREVFRTFGYGEIRTPILEETEVFIRSLGSETDIVGKEMYSFTDRGGKNVSLRPEGTASVIRAYIENLQNENTGVVKLHYSGPMFRGERPQKGRLRQFHQIGAEIIGASDPRVDVELILTLDRFLKALSVKDHTILINSLGCADDRGKYKDILRSYLKSKTDGLCGTCAQRAEKNVLRVFDCKDPKCRETLKQAPEITDFLCADCRKDFDILKLGLAGLSVRFEEREDLVRGLDYYTGIVFEVTHGSLGAQDAIAAGGRYDGLISEMGGKPAGATGFAAGVERLCLVMNRQVPEWDASGAFVVYMQEDLFGKAFEAANFLREKGVPADIDLTRRSFKSQMRRADREKKRFVVIIGSDEAESGKVRLKDMLTGKQTVMSIEETVCFF